MPSSFESPVTNQNDLAALPTGFADEYENAGMYSQNQTYEYPTNHMTTACPTKYSTMPITAPLSLSQRYNNSQYPSMPRPQVHKPSEENVVYANTQSSRKRKASVAPFENEAPIAKRIAVPERLAVAVQDPNGDFYDLKSEPSPYSSLVPTPTTMTTFQALHQPTGSPRVYGHHHSNSNVSHISMATPYTPTVSPSFTTANTEHSPHPPATPVARPSSAASNPRLVRTSTIPHHSPSAPSTGMHVAGHTQNFNPYTLYSPDSKARLHLDGNLDDVAQNWSTEELEARRKIIIFNRDQKGNDIYADFKVVSQNDWKNHPRSVSCIWWAEKKEAYVTSVDTILLLEALVAARFTVEEKNRIRRNLEGFKPDTVSKAKPETEEFFKVIMGFPNPKPRNIEKDVKVFPWKVLQIALQKIISKYSASYASTAGSISGSQARLYRGIEHSVEYPYAVSPGSEYHASMPQFANFPAYDPHGRVSAPVTPLPNMHHLTPTMPQGHEMPPTYNYPQAHVSQQQQQQQQQQ